MARNILAAVGLGSILLALAIWQFGFFSAKVEEVKTQIDRETAVARATAMIRDTQRRAEELTDSARRLRIEARSREIAVKRDADTLEKTRLATVTLANAAREAGLPKPSEAGADDLNKTISFAGRTLTGAAVYDTLRRWQADVSRGQRKQEVVESMVERIRRAADQLEAKQHRMIASVSDVQAKLEELEMQRDLARVESELAEMGANIRGEFAGDLGQAMETLQKEIDELQATTEVFGHLPEAGAPLTPAEALAGNAADVALRKQLDDLWESGQQE